MKIPTLTGIIERRILVNYQVDAAVLQRFLPEPFQPKLVKGKGIAGICLIRLKEVRPKGLPNWMSISSENGAHRIAVEWIANGVLKEGVYIPRRDTSSRLNAFAGGRIFPGEHHLANFKVQEAAGKYSIAFISDDGTSLSVEAEETGGWNDTSIFHNLNAASDFFRKSSVGYSATNNGECYDGLELCTRRWEVQSLKVLQVHSSFFENEDIFPAGSVIFDNALLMKNIPHEWKSLPSLSRELAAI